MAATEEMSCNEISNPHSFWVPLFHFVCDYSPVAAQKLVSEGIKTIAGTSLD